MPSIPPLSQDYFASRIMSHFPDGIGDDTQRALDEITHDWAEDNEAIDTSGEDDPDVVADLRSHTASNINNQGAGEQIRTLAHWGMDSEDIVALVVDDPSISQHARLALREIGRTGG